MQVAVRIFYGLLAAIAVVALCVIAYSETLGLLRAVPSKDDVVVDYNDLLTVLLTTVTVLFTVCAIVLTVLGIVGFRNLKREAGRFAESQALAEIAKAFGPSGNGTARIEHEMRNENGHHRQFVEKRIRLEVIDLLPLVINRINADAAKFAPDEPTDQGEVD